MFSSAGEIVSKEGSVAIDRFDLYNMHKSYFEVWESYDSSVYQTLYIEPNQLLAAKMSNLPEYVITR